MLLIIVLGCLAALTTFLAGIHYSNATSTNFMSDIVEFHVKFGLDYNGPPRVLPTDLANFRIAFMQEELDEYRETEQVMVVLVNDDGRPMLRKVNDIDKMLELELDALIDLAYVTLGTAYLQFGSEVFAEGWERVHSKNMLKVRKLKAGQGHTDSGRDAQYDVVKPEGWTPPNHIDLIRRRHKKGDKPELYLNKEFVD